MSPLLLSGRNGSGRTAVLRWLLRSSEILNLVTYRFDSPPNTHGIDHINEVNPEVMLVDIQV